MLKIKKKITAAFLVILLSISTILLAPARTEAYLGDRILNLGIQGYDVQQLQKNLGYLGYAVGQIDGIYGRETMQTVRDFQKNNGLAVDGVVGQETANAVIQQVSQPPSPRETTAPSRGAVPYSNRDIEDLARLVYGEARGESFTGQVAVAAVVLNRVASKQFGETIREVIFEPGAFTAVNDGQFYLQPDNSSYQAVQAALRGWDPTEEALYYWNPTTATNKWVWTRPIVTRIGEHVFAR
jgi:N-acetylmuramoyl-L-alanine amidase